MAGLFDLPAELRLYIYECVLCDVISQPETPWEQAPQSSSYSTFASLLTVGSPISREVKTIFNKKYATHMFFYFDDVLKLHDFRDWAAKQHDLHGLRFCLRVGTITCSGRYYYECYGPGSDDECDVIEERLTESAHKLIRSEPGLHSEWVRYDEQFPSARFWPWRYEHYVKSLPSDFHVRRGGRMRKAGLTQEATHVSVDFPLSLNGIQVTVHVEEGRSPRESCVHHSVAEMKGRLIDLTFSGLDVDRLRAEIFYARDSPWGRGRFYEASPDLDENERIEMDADSWGVPDREESDGDSNEPFDG